MPSNTEKQKRFMAAVANSPEFAKKVGVPQSVGKDFAAADKEDEEGPSMTEGQPMTIDDVLENGMEILGDYGAYEANLRGSETVDAGVESLKQLVEYYLYKLGLRDTDAEYYKKRHEAYQVIWDENSRLNKELLGHADRDERKDQEILNQRYNAMILAAMNAPQEGEEDEDNEVTSFKSFYNRRNNE
jgi:hypothetical protein